MRRLAAVGQKPFQEGKLIRHLPLFLAGLARDRSLPAIAAEPLRDRIVGRYVQEDEYADPRYDGNVRGSIFGDNGVVFGIGGKQGRGGEGGGVRGPDPRGAPRLPRALPGDGERAVAPRRADDDGGELLGAFTG